MPVGSVRYASDEHTDGEQRRNGKRTYDCDGAEQLPDGRSKCGDKRNEQQDEQQSAYNHLFASQAP
jgi:hypothetical protein